MRDSHARSIIKGITWRTTGTLDTMMMAYIVTGQIGSAVKIGLTEVITKIVLYYFHERLWNIIKFGRTETGPTHARSLTKGVSWRAVGTMDTIVVSYFITGQWFNALKIGGLEIFSKIALYYLHERVWAKIKWGRIFDERVTTSPAPSASAEAKKNEELVKETEVL
jgi:uncharacterized membrane protein